MKKTISKAEVKIVGISPLIIHKFTSEKLQAVEYDEEWKSTTYVNDKGNLYLPVANIQACMYVGGKSVKQGRGSMARFIYPAVVFTPLTPEILFNGKVITLDDIQKNGWLTTVPVVVGKSRIPRTRTTLNLGWEIDFDIILMSDVVRLKDIQEVIENAGFVAGLGDSRPSSPYKPGPNGRFEVKSFKTI